MGYPTSVQTFTNKNTGQIVQPAHVNDLQTEVTALENGLLTGLQHGLSVSTGGLTVSTGNTVLGQHLQVAGNSSVTGALTVGGNSSLTGNLHVAGNSTFAGSVAFTGTIVGLPLGPPVVRVGISTRVDIASNTWVGVNWDTEDYDSHGMHSTASNSSRLTCVQSTGRYHFGAVVDWNYSGGGSSGAVKARILINDSTSPGNIVSAVMANFNNEGAGFMTVSGDIRIANTTDYATLQVFTRTSTRSLVPAGDAVTAFWAHQIST